MKRLSPADRNQLLSLLASQPLLQTYRGRRQLLELAGLDAVIPQIDLEGPPLVAIGEIIQVLDVYGQLAHGIAALGLFLNSVNATIGAGDPAGRVIDDILMRYQLMTPVSMTDFATPWAGPDRLDELQEKIIGENTLRHVSFLECGVVAARSVAFINVGEWSGTGFMVSPTLIITNNHVLPSRELAKSAVYQFNYQLTANGGDAITHAYTAKADGMFVTSERLDFTVVELDKSAGSDWGFLRCAKRAAAVGQRVNIIQHPAGMHKQISIQNNFVQYVDDTYVQYVTATLGGSSGSPVLNDDWQVVGVHHAGGILTEPRTGKSVFRNEGIAISTILSALPDPARAAIAVPS